MGLYRLLWLCMDYYGFVWITIGLYGLLWLCMDFYGFVWITMGLYRFVNFCMDSWILGLVLGLGFCYEKF